MNSQDSHRIRRGRNRAAAIVIVRGYILLVKRNRRGAGEYYVFPGGGVESGESPADAVVRELHEETGLHGRIARLVFTSHTVSGGRQDYFLVDTPFLPIALPRSAPERNPAYRRERGSSRPVWIPMRTVSGLRIFPAEIKRLLPRLLHKGLPKKVLDFGIIGFREKR